MKESKPNQIKVPVAVLKAGETRSIQTVLEFPDPPVTFKLVEGNGPVYVHGQTVPGNYEIEDTTELSGEEEEEVWPCAFMHLPLHVRLSLNIESIIWCLFQDDDEEEAKMANSKAKNAKNGKK